MSRIPIFAAVILIVAAMFLVARPKFQNPINGKSNSVDSVANPTAGSADFAEDSSLPSRSKSRDRVIHRKPTLEETNDLLRNTVIPRVEIEDLSVGEAVHKIRTLIQDAGIEPHQLRIVCDMSAPYSQTRIRDLKLRNVPLAVIFKYICDSTTLRYRVNPGVLEFKSMSDDPFEGVEFEGPDPFAASDSSKQPLDPDDPFSRTSQEEEGPDPFAEP